MLTVRYNSIDYIFSITTHSEGVFLSENTLRMEPPTHKTPFIEQKKQTHTPQETLQQKLFLLTIIK